MGGQHLMNSNTELPLCFQRGMAFLSHYCQLAKALGFQWFTACGILGLSVSTVKEMIYSVVVSVGSSLPEVPCEPGGW